MTQAKLFGRWVSALGLVGCLVAVGCSKKEEATIQPVVTAPATPEVKPPAPAPAEPAPAPAQPAAPAEPARPAAPDAQPVPAPTGGVAPEDPKNREWTAATVKLERASLKPVTLRSVREARNEGFDRVVFEFEGTQVPGYHLEYVDKPVLHCASGNEIPVAGQGFLQVRLTPAQAHDAGGNVTVAERERKPALPVLQELELICDFEGEVTWVLGNASPKKFRVMELREPTRLVVDVQH